MLVRMLGIFGVILSSGYLLQGVSFVFTLREVLLRRESYAVVYSFVVMSLDLVFGVSLAIAAVGLLFLQGWAKKMWLLTLSVVAVLHLLIAVLSQLGQGVGTFYLVWTWMVMLAFALSWWILTKRPQNAPSGANGQAALLPPSVPPQ
jgi:hypothetical protein